MSKSRLLATLAAGAFGIALLGACSADALTERAASFGVEQALEAQGEDVDFDFSNGGINVSTDEGDFSFSVDDENGTILFDSPDGSGAIQFDENGIAFDTEDGSGTVTGGANGFTIQSDDGTSVFGSTEVPDGWPAVIGLPATAVPGETYFSVLNLPGGLSLTGIFTHATSEDFGGAVEARLVADGYGVTWEAEQPTGRSVQLSKGADTVVIVADNEGVTTVSATTAT